MNLSSTYTYSCAQICLQKCVLGHIVCNNKKQKELKIPICRDWVNTKWHIDALQYCAALEKIWCRTFCTDVEKPLHALSSEANEGKKKTTVYRISFSFSPMLDFSLLFFFLGEAVNSYVCVCVCEIVLEACMGKLDSGYL